MKETMPGRTYVLQTASFALLDSPLILHLAQLTARPQVKVSKSLL